MMSINIGFIYTLSYGSLLYLLFLHFWAHDWNGNPYKLSLSFFFSTDFEQQGILKPQPNSHDSHSAFSYQIQKLKIRVEHIEETYRNILKCLPSRLLFLTWYILYLLLFFFFFTHDQVRFPISDYGIQFTESAYPVSLTKNVIHRFSVSNKIQLVLQWLDLRVLNKLELVTAQFQNPNSITINCP